MCSYVVIWPFSMVLELRMLCHWFRLYCAANGSAAECHHACARAICEKGASCSPAVLSLPGGRLAQLSCVAHKAHRQALSSGALWYRAIRRRRHRCHRG